jgi:hypothetical protein
MDDIAFLRYRRIMRWVVETLNPTVDAEIGALPADMRARFVRFTDIIEEVGFEALPRDSVSISKAISGSCAWPGATAFRAPST